MKLSTWHCEAELYWAPILQLTNTKGKCSLCSKHLLFDTMISLGDLPLAHPVHVQLHKITKDTNIAIWTIENGKPKQLQGSINIHPAQSVLKSGSHTLAYQQIDDVAICIDTLAKAPTTYATITQNTLFRQFYKVASHPILYANGSHAQALRHHPAPAVHADRPPAPASRWPPRSRCENTARVWPYACCASG
ncbi:hypothetical protein BDV95DRAFT_189256 [Massariosphaeria phaeospora]|uniref:Uncharacterized protein n=1 Tax=Massariosphaeria phaeospora TaxID=100035 RepID=A0A7C8I004_9PLEO|nr:hypothetical protein BDV95DRAFT_189256 [Massariosphaeria phaeospora]